MAKSCLKTVFNICYFLGVTPYSWSKAPNYVELTKSKVKLLHWKANLILYTFYVCFLVVRYIQLHLRPDGVTTKEDMRSFLLSSLITFSFFKEFTKNLDTGYILLNRIIRLSDEAEIESNGQPQSEEETKALMKVRKAGKNKLRFEIFFLPTIVSMYTTRMLLRPERANHFTSTMQDPRSLTVLQRLPFAVAHAYIWLLLYGGVLYAFAVLVFFGKTMQEYMCFLTRSPQTGDPKRWRIESFLKLYPRLCVIQLEFNSIWGNIFCYFLSLFVASQILCLYHLVMIHTPRALLMTLVLTFTMYCVVEAAAEHYVSSRRLLASLKSDGSHFLRKYLQSCRPLRTINGGFGFIDKPVMLTLWTIVIENAVTLIVGNKHKRSG